MAKETKVANSRVDFRRCFSMLLAGTEVFYILVDERQL